MKPIDSAWAILKQPEAHETPGMGGSGAQAFIDPSGRAMGQAGPFMFNIGAGGTGRPSTASLLHRLATGQAPVGQGTRRAVLGRAGGTGLGLLNAALAADRAQRGGDIESALGAAYAGYQVPKQAVVGAAEGQWAQKPMLDAHGRPLLDEEGKPRLHPEATPGGAIGGQMEAADLTNAYLQQRRDARTGGPLNPNPMGLGENWQNMLDPRREMPIQYGESQVLPQYQAPQTAPTLGELAAQREQAEPVAGYPASADLEQMRQEMQRQQAPLGAGDIFNQKGEPMDLAFRMLKEAMA